MSTVFKDFSKIDLDSKQGQANFVGAINHFMRTPSSVHNRIGGQVQELVRKVQELATTSDFPANVKEAIATFRPSDDEIDTGYEQIFDIRDFTQTAKDGFKIRDTSSGLTFAAVKAGAKAKVYKVTGTEVSVSFDRYGAALEWDKTWFDDQDWWAIEDRAKEFRYKWYDAKADAFYALIDALAAGINVAWQATAVAATNPLYQLERDVQTINTACGEIITALTEAGQGVTQRSQFQIVAPLLLMPRIVRVLGASYTLPNANNATQVAYNVQPVFTTHLTSASAYYVCIPKSKAKGGNRQDLTVLTDFDILAYAELAAGWGRYGGAISEANQFRRCATA